MLYFGKELNEGYCLISWHTCKHKKNFLLLCIFQCNLGYFKGDFDVGVCLHACGVATDMVLQQCIDRKASFVLCPCCYGSIQNTHLINYPRSQYYRKAGFTDKV